MEDTVHLQKQGQDSLKTRILETVVLNRVVVVTCITDIGKKYSIIYKRFTTKLNIKRNLKKFKTLRKSVSHNYYRSQTIRHSAMYGICSCGKLKYW